MENVNQEGILPEEEFEGGIVTVLDDDGAEHQFELIDTLELDGAQYVALLSLEEEEILESDGELILLEITQEDGKDILTAIEDETVFQQVAAQFEERLADLYEIDEMD